MIRTVTEINILVKTHKGQKNYVFLEDEVIIGRSKKSTLHIPLEGMSRKHFKISKTDHGVLLFDLKSANGTNLNGKKIKANEPTLLMKGDVVDIPGVQVSFSVDYDVIEDCAEVLITEDMLKEDDENGSGSDINIEFVYEEDKSFADESKQMSFENKEEVTESNLKFNNQEDSLDENNLASFEISKEKIQKSEESINANEKIHLITEQNIIKEIKDFKKDNATKADLKRKIKSDQMEHVELEDRYNEIERLDKVCAKKKKEIYALNERLGSIKKNEIDRLKKIENQKSKEIDKEKKEFELYKKAQELKIMRLKADKESEVAKEKGEAFLKIEIECSSYKNKLIKEIEAEIKNVRDMEVERIDLERNEILKETRKVFDEAKDEAEIIILNAERESRKRKDEDYKKVLKYQRDNNIEALKLKREIEEDGKKYFKSLKEEASIVLEMAKKEAGDLKEQVYLEVEKIKSDTSAITREAEAKVESSRKESFELSEAAKVKADKILRNAYSTAMLMKNTSQEKIENIENEQSFFNELENEFPEYDSLHRNEVNNVFSLINKTSQEMEDLLKEKQEIFEKEQILLRESEFKKRQVEAREDAIKIKALAENEAEEIIRNSYIHSKVIETEAQNKINEKRCELEKISKDIQSDIDIMKIELDTLESKASEKELQVIDLTKVRDSLEVSKKSEEDQLNDFLKSSKNKKIDYKQKIEDLERNYNKDFKKLAVLQKDLSEFENDSDVSRKKLKNQVDTLTNDKERLVVEIEPLRLEVNNLRNEKDKLYLENPSFFEEYNKKKQEFQELEILNINLGSKSEESQLLIKQYEKEIEQDKNQLETIRYESKNIERELSSRRKEADIEINDLLRSAKREEKELRAELEVIKKNKQAYAEEEIEELKKEARKKCNGIVSSGEEKKKSIIKEGRLASEKLRDETKKWVKEVQEKIDIKNQEIEKIEKEGILFLRDKKSEAEELYNEKVLTAEKDVKKKESDSNKKILLINNKFQEKMKQKEDSFNLEKKDFFESIEENKKKILEEANKEIEQKIKKSEDHALKILSDAKTESTSLRESSASEASRVISNTKKEASQIISEAKAESRKIALEAKVEASKMASSAKRKESEALRQKEAILSNIEKDSKVLRDKLNKELAEHRRLSENDISQMKVKELEIRKIKRNEIEQQISGRKKSYVAEITESVGILLQIKIKKIFGKKMSDEHFHKLRSELKGIVDAAVFPVENTKNGPNKILMGAGKIAPNVKKFYIKVAAGIIIPILTLVISLVFPNFFSSIKNGLVSSIKTDESASDLFLKREIEKRKNKPKFEPKVTSDFKESYTDNMIYTRMYSDLVMNPDFIDKWTISLNKYIVDELELSDNVIVSLISNENNMHRQLLEDRNKININFVEKSIEKMREKEKSFSGKIKSLFSSEKDFIKFKKFKKNYFIDYRKSQQN